MVSIPKSDLAISLCGVSKSYTISHARQKFSTLAETLLHRARTPLQRESRETFWALKDLSFDVKRGDVVGIIGRNGAGKSTLLKILSRITEPSGGKIDLYGRVGSLLEVGTGFHPELTGRENIYLNGAILGMRRGEIDRQFEAIVEFAGVEQFLDTPVKRYSSGMYVRLAFAVAAHLQSEILIVDEVLAVGDSEFQSKCLGKMKSVANSGRTVLFVSHHMQSVKALCNRGIYLERGVRAQVTEVDEAIDRYVQSFSRKSGVACDPETRTGTGELRFTAVTAQKETFTCDEQKIIDFTISRRREFNAKFYVSAHIVNSSGLTILHCDSRAVGAWYECKSEITGSLSVRTPWLKPGRYRVEMFICCAGILDRYEEACYFEVLPLFPYPAAVSDDAIANGIALADFLYTRDECSAQIIAT